MIVLTFVLNVPFLRVVVNLMPMLAEQRESSKNSFTPIPLVKMLTVSEADVSAVRVYLLFLFFCDFMLVFFQIFLMQAYDFFITDF